MGSQIFTMRRDDRSLEFGDVEVDRYEPDETISIIEEDIFLLSPWAMRYIGDDSTEQMEALDFLFDFWIFRGNIFFTEQPLLEIRGVVQNHPDFPDGVTVTLPFLDLRRATREGVETQIHGIAGSKTCRLAHDLLVATTPNGLEVAFFSDDSLFRLDDVCRPSEAQA